METVDNVFNWLEEVVSFSRSLGLNTLISPQISSSWKLADCPHLRARKETVGQKLAILINWLKKNLDCLGLFEIILKCFSDWVLALVSIANFNFEKYLFSIEIWNLISSKWLYLYYISIAMVEKKDWAN